jgi:hypothetical protein
VSTAEHHPYRVMFSEAAGMQRRHDHQSAEHRDSTATRNDTMTNSIRTNAARFVPLLAGWVAFAQVQYRRERSIWAMFTSLR